jgi:uncharacterized protein (DUF58 family)
MKHAQFYTGSEGVRLALERARAIELRTRKLVEEQLSGGYRSPFSGRGMDFDEVREYVAGDDVRAIDWNLTARAGHPFVKKFREERELTVVLAVDVSASGDFGSKHESRREVLAELSAVLALVALRSRDRLGLVLFSDRVERYVPPAAGRGHVLRLLSEILNAEPTGTGTDIAAALEHVQKTVRRRAVVLLLSDLFDGGDPERLSRQLQVSARKHEVFTFWLHDPHELALPDVGSLLLEDAESGEVVRLETGQRRVRERFVELARARRERLRRDLHGARARVLELTLGDDYWPALRGFLRGAAGRRAE